MKCRKPKCAETGGVGVLTQSICGGLPIYQCEKCGRKWALGKFPVKGRKVRVKE